MAAKVPSDGRYLWHSALKVPATTPIARRTLRRGFRRRHSYAAVQALISWFSRAEELLQRASLVLASNANHTLLCFFRGASLALEPVVLLADQEGREKYSIYFFFFGFLSALLF